MKSLYTIFLLAAICFSSYSQDKCKDVIYPVKEERVIVNCCILQVVDGNTVVYVKHGDTARIEAGSIILEGRKILLSKNIKEIGKIPDNSQMEAVRSYKYDYEHYEKQYKKASLQRNIGIASTFAGLTLEVVGLVMSDFPMGSGEGIGFFYVGFVLRNVGIPVWISGGIKRANNRKAMNDLEMNKKFSFEVTNDGISLVIKI